MQAKLPHNYVAIIAPYPGQDRFMDGWMSRIRTIDLALQQYPRVYVDFQDWFPASSEPEIVASGEGLLALRLNPQSKSHRELADSIFKTSKFIYVHTMHQCEYALDYFDPDKMLVDIHGVVPEEELMLGSPERSEKFGQIEAAVFKQLKHAFVVTNTMKKHFSLKYPDARADLYHLPVYDFDAAENTKDNLPDIFALRRQKQKDMAIYAGGAQVWQCVDEMLSLMEDNHEINDYVIYSHDEALFSSLVSKHGLPATVFQGYSDKEKLKTAYKQSNFGFVLRKESTVNRVASPTKICDYCAAAVIPIVDFAGIGDFEDYGYSYIKSEDYRVGYIPDIETQFWMAKNNLRCMQRMEREFHSGIQLLQTLVDAKLN